MRAREADRMEARRAAQAAMAAEDRRKAADAAERARRRLDVVGRTPLTLEGVERCFVRRGSVISWSLLGARRGVIP